MTFHSQVQNSLVDRLITRSDFLQAVDAGIKQNSLYKKVKLEVSELLYVAHNIDQ